MSAIPVTIVSAWFPPEPAPFGQMMRELAQALAAEGFAVTVVTSCPNHPQGVLHEGYRHRWVHEERDGTVRVLRVLTWARAAGSSGGPRSMASRAFGLLLYTAVSWIVAATHTSPIVIFGVLQPLTVGITLPWLARMKRARLILNVQDLHPDALVDLGLLRQRRVIEALRAVERRAYARADWLTVICEGFRTHCLARGARESRVAVIPNWLDLEEVRPWHGPNTLRAQLRLADSQRVVLFAGTIGLVSGAEVVVDAARRLAGRDDIHFVFVGDGLLLPELRRRVDGDGQRNVSFLPFQPRARLAEVQGIADVSLVTLRAGHGRTSVPSKLLGYMAAARPVIAAVDEDSETARLVREAGAGRVVPPEDAAALAQAIGDLVDAGDEARALGEAGRRYLERHYSKPAALRRYVELFRAAAGVVS